MGIGGLLLLCAVFGTVAGIIAIVGVVVARYTSGLFRVTGVLVAVLGFPCALGAGIFALVGIVNISRGPQVSTSRSQFETEFGVSPGPDVQAVRSESFGSTDFHQHFLRFRCSPQTITTITRRFRPALASECQRAFQAPATAAVWWRPRKSPSTLCFAAKPFDGAFASNDAWLLYDPQSRDAYFAYQGID